MAHVPRRSVERGGLPTSLERAVEETRLTRGLRTGNTPPAPSTQQGFVCLGFPDECLWCDAREFWCWALRLDGGGGRLAVGYSRKVTGELNKSERLLLPVVSQS